jgi:hypothetical protein
MFRLLDTRNRHARASCMLALLTSCAAMADVPSKRVIGIAQSLPSSLGAPVGMPFSSTLMVEARDGSFIPWDTRVPMPVHARFKIKTYIPCEGQLSMFAVDSSGEVVKPALMIQRVEGEQEALSELMGLDGADKDERMRVELTPQPKQTSELTKGEITTGLKCTNAWDNDLHFTVDDGEAPTPKLLLTPLISPILGGIGQLVFEWASQRLAQWWQPGELSEPGYALLELPPEQRWKPALAASTTIQGEPHIPVYPKPANGLIDWTDAINHQGAQVALVLLDDQLRERELKPLGSQLKPGEKFKIRLTTTFTALATLARERDSSDATSLPVVPTKGDHVLQLQAGRSVDMPPGMREYLIAPSEKTKERLVLTLRHILATPTTASQQPVYRANTPTHSTLLQLTPPGRRAAIAQAVLLQER